MAERFARNAGSIGLIEAARNAEIARANKIADDELAPLIAERDAIAGKLEDWWAEAGAELTHGKRKSIALGGCMIGTRVARQTLQIAGDEAAVVDMLGALRWGKAFLRHRITLDRATLLKALDGKHAVAIADMGVSASGGEPVFFVSAVEQGGTIG